MELSRSLSNRHILFFLLLLLIVGSCLGTAPATAEAWLCPYCQVERIEVDEGVMEFSCPSCEILTTPADLRIDVAYISLRTRPTAVIWEIAPECGIFRNEGLLATPPTGHVWVPWSAVDYWIPRQRILRLTSGEEFLTPYAKGPDCTKEQQHIIIATIADSVGDFIKGRTVQTRSVEEEMSSLFLMARSPAARDSGRARFIAEVEAGNHRRLPRTDPRSHRLTTPSVPDSFAGESMNVVLEVRTDERGRIMKINRLKGSGVPDADRLALLAAYRTAITVGGEMGAGVPSSFVLHYFFDNGTVTVEGEPANPSMWKEWVEPPQN